MKCDCHRCSIKPIEGWMRQRDEVVRESLLIKEGSNVETKWEAID